MNVAGLIVVVGVGAVLAVGVGPVLRRLPEPVPIDPSDLEPPPEADVGAAQATAEAPKIRYADLARAPFVIRTTVLAVAAAAIVVALLPARFWPPWLVLCVIGVLLACIDGATTWLPWRLTWPGWVAMLAAAALSLGLGASWSAVLRLIGAGLIAWLWYLFVYLITRRQLGLGDVWLAPLVGAPAGMISFTGLYLALLLGALVGGLHGLILLARGRRGGFPYAPSIVIGGFLTPVVQALIGR